MNENQKNILLDIVRDAVNAAVGGQAIESPVSDDDDLNLECGCFVTLKNSDNLRGCLGQFTSDKPIIELISEIAQASASKDSRFSANPITGDELDELDVEISLLSPLKKTDNPLSLRLGIDGIYIVNGGRSGCFLPQVATEIGWNKEEFLSYCCSGKAGLSPNAWKDPDTEVFLFTAEIFGARFDDV
ncbi:MAG: AmmeMemoRadiSam system protein A [Planctomycetes bacterium]|nr:AmmeMemoRadiSam system protein A [Planctomycetota bacterium]